MRRDTRRSRTPTVTMKVTSCVKAQGLCMREICLTRRVTKTSDDSTLPGIELSLNGVLAHTCMCCRCENPLSLHARLYLAAPGSFHTVRSPSEYLARVCSCV